MVLIRKSIEDIYRNNTDIKELYEGLHSSIPGILQWYQLCSHQLASTIKVKRILKTEDVIWCPEWGLKGIIDVSCKVTVDSQELQIPVEIKTGSEEPVSHNAQILLYSILLSQRDSQSDFILYRSQDLSGLLVYLKSDQIKEFNPVNQSNYDEIKQELETGKRGNYIISILQYVKKQTEYLLNPYLQSPSSQPPSSISLKQQSISILHLRYLIMRRNLIVMYKEQEKSKMQKVLKDSQRSGLACDTSRIVNRNTSNDIEDLFPELPDACSNFINCEKCGYLPMCAILAKLDETQDCKKPSVFPERQISLNHVIAEYGKGITPNAVLYFQKWVRIEIVLIFQFSLIQLERCCEESEQGCFWTKSTHQRETLGLTISKAILVKMEKCEEKDHIHTIKDIRIKCIHNSGFVYCFETTSLISVHSFCEGDQVIVSGCDGQWGLIYGNIDSINSLPDTVMVILSAVTRLAILESSSPIGHVFRIDRYRSVDLSLVAVHNLVQFVAHRQSDTESSQPLETLFSQRGADVDTNITVMNWPLLRRLREIVIDGDSPHIHSHYRNVWEWMNEKQGLSQQSLLSVLCTLLLQCNSDQQKAIVLALNSEDLAIIQGLPGAGKTLVIVVLCLMFVVEGKRVLISSHTHSAIDNVLMKLIPYRERSVENSSIDLSILRLGEQLRVHPLVRPYTLSALWSGKLDDYLFLQNHSQILGATVYTNISQFPRNIVFDYCIIDEAGQITEPSILQVMLLARKVLLVGDSKQLPPLVQSDMNSEDGLSMSLLTRLENRSDSDSFSVRLTIQYRMNESIMGLSNHLIYNNCMKTGNDKVTNEWL